MQSGSQSNLLWISKYEPSVHSLWSEFCHRSLIYFILLTTEASRRSLKNLELFLNLLSFTCMMLILTVEIVIKYTVSAGVRHHQHKSS